MSLNNVRNFIRGYEFKMANKKQSKIKVFLRLIIGIILYGLLGWIFFIGIACPNFNRPFITIYRGIGAGMIYPLYFLLIPTHTNKVHPDIRYSGAIVSVTSFIVTVILLFNTYPLNVL